MTNKIKKVKETEYRIFSSDIFDEFPKDEDKYEAFKEYCNCRDEEELLDKYKTWGDIEKNSDLESEIFDFMYEYIETYYDSLKEDLRNIYKNEHFLLSGSLGLWDGHHDGYKYCKDIDAVLSTLGNYDVAEIVYDFEAKCTALRLHHHDGTNYMYLKKLNSRVYAVAEDRGVSLKDLYLEDFQKINSPYYCSKVNMMNDLKNYRNK